MKYVSLDIETTGLDPRTCQVIELAMVLEDTENIQPIEELPHARFLFRHAKITGSWFAIKMNMDLLEETQQTRVKPEWVWSQVDEQLASWGFDRYNKATLAGKNVGVFDMQFLPPNVRARIHHRCIDPGSVFMDWEDGVQSLSQLLQRDVAHTALQDARDVIEVLRRAYT